MSTPNWIKKGEYIWAEGDPQDVINRPLRDVLEQSGYRRDGTDFAGFMTVPQLVLLTNSSGSVTSSITYVTNSITNITSSNSYTSSTFYTTSSNSYLTQYITSSVSSSLTTIITPSGSFSPLGFDPRTFGAAVDGATNDAAAIASANASASLSGKAVFYPAGTYRIGANLTLTAPSIFAPGALLQTDISAVLTVSNSISASPVRVFTGSGSVVFSKNIAMDGVYPQWWGAVGNNSVDCGPAFTSASVTGYDITVVPGKYNFATTASIDVNLRVRVGALLSPSVNVPVYVNKTVDAGYYRWIDYTKGGYVSFWNGRIKEVTPYWWGLSQVDASFTDDVPSLDAMIAAIPNYTTCYFPPNTTINLFQTWQYIDRAGIIVTSRVDARSTEGPAPVFKWLGPYGGRMVYMNASRFCDVSGFYFVANGAEVCLDLDGGQWGSPRFFNGSITSGSRVLTDLSGQFALRDTGQNLWIPGAGPGGTTLHTFVGAFINTSSVSLDPMYSASAATLTGQANIQLGDGARFGTQCNIHHNNFLNSGVNPNFKAVRIANFTGQGTNQEYHEIHHCSIDGYSNGAYERGNISIVSGSNLLVKAGGFSPSVSGSRVQVANAGPLVVAPTLSYIDSLDTTILSVTNGTASLAVTASHTVSNVDAYVGGGAGYGVAIGPSFNAKGINVLDMIMYGLRAGVSIVGGSVRCERNSFTYCDINYYLGRITEAFYDISGDSEQSRQYCVTGGAGAPIYILGVRSDVSNTPPGRGHFGLLSGGGTMYVEHGRTENDIPTYAFIYEGNPSAYSYPSLIHEEDFAMGNVVPAAQYFKFPTLAYTSIGSFKNFHVDGIGTAEFTNSTGDVGATAALSGVYRNRGFGGPGVGLRGATYGGMGQIEATAVQGAPAVDGGSSQGRLFKAFEALMPGSTASVGDVAGLFVTTGSNASSLTGIIISPMQNATVPIGYGIDQRGTLDVNYLKGKTYLAASASVPATTEMFSGSMGFFTDDQTHDVKVKVLYSDGVAKTSTLGGIPFVTSSKDRNLIVTNSLVPTRVFNLTNNEFQRSGFGKWITETDHPNSMVNAKKFVDVSWYDSLGRAPMERESDEVISQSDIDNHPEWRGHYYAGIDTYSYVCLHEAMLEAWAPGSVSGSTPYQWASGTNSKGVYAPSGLYLTTRPLWMHNLTGGNLHGGGRWATTITNLISDCRTIWTDGINHSHWRDFTVEQRGNWEGNNKIRSNFWAPLVDVGWMGNTQQHSYAGSKPGDMTPRTIVSSSAPFVKVTNAGWRPGQWEGKYVVVVRDFSFNGYKTGQTMRILQNTSDTLYIAGLWDFTAPDSASAIILDPLAFGQGCYHTSTSLVDWGTNYKPDFTNINGVNASGSILYTFPNYQQANSNQATLPYQNVIASCTPTQLNLATPFVAVPSPGATGNSGTGDILHGNLTGEAARETSIFSNYCIGGTLYTSSVAQPITGSNDCWVQVSGAPFTASQHFGCFAEFIQGNGTGPMTLNNYDGGNYTVIPVNGYNRAPNIDNGKRLYVVDGPKKGQWAYIDSNTANVINLNYSRNLNLTGTERVAVADPVVGQVLTIADNDTNRLYFTQDEQKNLFYRVPQPGDMFHILPRMGETSTQGCTFQNVMFQGGDLAFAWTKQGDGSMGSETSFYDCTFVGGRVGFYANGYNIINVHIKGGSSGGYQHSFYVPRGWISVEGVSFGNDPNSQAGHEILISQGSAGSSIINGCYTEAPLLLNAGSPMSMIACQVNFGISTQGTFNRVWTAGDVWLPTNHRGRLFRCVQVHGNGNTSASIEPVHVAETQNPIVDIIDGGGNGAKFIRYDFPSIGGAAPVTLLQTTIAWGQVGPNGGGLALGCTFTRPDWMGVQEGGSAASGGNDFVALSNKIYPNLMLGGGTYDQSNEFFQGDWSFEEPSIHQNIIGAGHMWWNTGWNGQSTKVGLGPFTSQELQTKFNNRVLAFLDGGNGINQGESWSFSKRPRSGSNLNGYDMMIGGGMGTGAGQGGKLRFQISPSGSNQSTGSNTVNSLVDAVEIDYTKRMRFYGRTVFNIGTTQNLVSIPDVGSVDYLVLSNSGSTTITNFTSSLAPLEDGQRLTLEFTNSNTMVQSNTNIKLSGSLGMTGSLDSTLTLFLRGNVWREIGRSVR